MQPNIGWHEIVIRLLWTVAASVFIGLNREEHGHGVGLRTTLLVCLAASISMLQVNLLLGLTGKASDSFVVMDLMRLPLGILSGMGFIGAGAILRRNHAVTGVTTAATLWFVTVMGLCFGGGQINLGIVALILGFVTLTGLKRAEKLWKQDCSATLHIVVGENQLHDEQITRAFAGTGYKIKFISVIYGENAKLCEANCEVHWCGRIDEPRLPEFLKQFSSQFALSKVEWQNVANH